MIGAAEIICVIYLSQHLFSKTVCRHPVHLQVNPCVQTNLNVNTSAETGSRLSPISGFRIVMQGQGRRYDTYTTGVILDVDLIGDSHSELRWYLQCKAPFTDHSKIKGEVIHMPASVHRSDVGWWLI